ncbi:DUF2188 domain-containing protein [Cupriavidus taiwanensis]|uniref:DUF2188 domain-containing protein n=2 Tax=Cupriavidus taiwanensis TaxID=164546 RepID=B3R516_CUPTR|nr:DUF2188 domain-containing protein [Cupriavidus taiwanensis]CAQ69398.1 conserved hypothetical protein [Cupriavidus taiwanensis LMG 19424]SOY58659.1 conserved hypothetical protein [Cupriavidus taiwanensis]SOY85475.1 conserved hypothetical protein [Cupriavidus taiwanensis]SOZ03926.1 conserved hypothetical protein [Cupriavidus taiwanensis]SOZ04448.1 conserved hypothetical protein [Cupriavidus taiwanensis]
MQARIIRVTPLDAGWALDTESMPQPQRFPTLEDAISAGWAQAMRENGELHIHRHDGGLRLRATVGPEESHG